MYLCKAEPKGIPEVDKTQGREGVLLSLSNDGVASICVEWPAYAWSGQHMRGVVEWPAYAWSGQHMRGVASICVEWPAYAWSGQHMRGVASMRVYATVYSPKEPFCSDLCTIELPITDVRAIGQKLAGSCVFLSLHGDDICMEP